VLVLTLQTNRVVTGLALTLMWVEGMMAGCGGVALALAASTP
jgi:hypothetical protein